MQIKNKNILVVGLGISGIEICHFLSAMDANIAVTDSLPEKFQSISEDFKRLKIEATFVSQCSENFSRADLIILSPGVPHTIEAVLHAKKKGIPVIGEIEFASCFINEPIIAITGTNGKTTTTTLLGNMLEYSGKDVFVGGNIGNPLISYARIRDKSQLVVAEISSFQLDTIKNFRPDVSILLNITEDHLDRYSDMTSYASSKMKIFENQTLNDFAIINGKDKFIQAMKSKINSQVINFNCENNSENNSEKKVVIDEKSIFLPFANWSIDISKTKLSGKHNYENIAAASAAAWVKGASLSGVQKAIDEFKGLPHRMEFVSNINGIDFYNDSKATNIDATVKAITSFKAPIRLILGGRDKGGDYKILKTIIKKHVVQLIVLGEARQQILSALSDINIDNNLEGSSEKSIDIRDFGIDRDSLERSVEFLYKSSNPGDIILFSPACSSFDMFDSYAKRGNVFKDIVKRL